MHPSNTKTTILAAVILSGCLNAGLYGQGTRTRSSMTGGADPAEAALARGDWDAAVAGFEAQVKKTPAAAAPRLKLGVALLASGRAPDAVVILRQALKLSPSMTAAREYLAAALAESGQCREAIPMLKKDLAGMSNADLKRAAGLAAVRCAVSGGNPQDAVDFIRILHRDFPKDPEVLYQAVHLYSDLSLRASQDLLMNAPASYQVRLLNAEALETQERWNEAAAEYRAILSQNPSLPGVHYRLGRLLLSLPESMTGPATRDEAKTQFEEELKLNPRNAGAEYVLGELARQSRDYSAAIEHFSKAASLNPGFADNFIGLGRALIADRKFSDAVAPLEQAVRLQPENPAAHYHLAIVYSRTGRKEQADKATTAFHETSARATQMRQSVQTGLLAPQKAEP
jgi:tetratricopeptide (TPR) repeat protein